jgi:ribosome-associated translation inhibitor RaiA
MKVSIQGHGLQLSKGERHHAARQLLFAFDWARHDILTVTLQLSDINGPRGGVDKRCQLRISHQRVRDVIVEDVAPDVTQAVSRAVDRAARTLQRRVGRAREFGYWLPYP